MEQLFIEKAFEKYNAAEQKLSLTVSDLLCLSSALNVVETVYGHSEIARVLNVAINSAINDFTHRKAAVSVEIEA